MTKLLLNRSKRIIILMALVIGLGWFNNGSLLAQQGNDKKPLLPVLSLGVDDPEAKVRSENAWYPDNRIWVVPSTKADAKEVIIPVFINNRWYTHPEFAESYTTQPISSFSFRLYYNDKVLEFLGLQTQHPYTADEALGLGITKFDRGVDLNDYTNPLAEHFNLTASDNTVTDYTRFFDKYADTADTKGRAVTITGVAFNDNTLDTTGLNGYLVLLYVKFRVKGEVGSLTPEQQSCYLYFDPTYILYNGVNITNDIPGKLVERYSIPAHANITGYLQERSANFQYWDEVKYNQYYGTAGFLKSDIAGSLVGLPSSTFTNINLDKYDNEPYLPGSILLKVMNDRPEFEFIVENTSSALAVQDQIYRDTADRSTWILSDPITTDYPMTNNPSAFVGKRFVDIGLSSDGYAMKDIIIESDQEWLQFRTETVQGSSDYKNKIIDKTRRGYIDYIDAIVGKTTESPFTTDPDRQYTPDKKVRLAIYCEVESIIGKHGIYTGYITLRSRDDKFRPTRIKVTFIYFANPIENNSTVGSPNPKNAHPYGIHLTLTPKNGVDVSNSAHLIMGSAYRATDYVDTLYGEFAYKTPLGIGRDSKKIFDARFFLDSIVYPRPTNKELVSQWLDLVKNGFGDFAQSEENPRSVSRDIRNLDDTVQSHIYTIKFKWDAAQLPEDYFPVVLKWTTNEFPENTAAFLHTVINGADHYIDMRNEGTPIGNNNFTYTFYDKSITEFSIEYTIGIETVEDLVDNFGNAMIKANGWNFLSLPLKPISSYYSYIFKNALNIPFEFSLNNWQQPADGKLRPGVGYFIKYGTAIDKKFAGTYFFKIDKNNYPVKLYTGDEGSYGDAGGWNAIGGLSVRYPVYDPTGIAGIQLEEELITEIPDMAYTQKHGVWAYKTHGGYEEVATLYPGMGYWIKVDKNCYLKLDASKAKSVIDVEPAMPNKTVSFDKISIADNAQHNTAIYATMKYADVNSYELPPVPPSGLFDVRFAGNSYVTNKKESVVLLQGVSYPVLVSIENPRVDYSIVDVQTGEVYGSISAGNSGNVIINNCKANAFKLVAIENENVGSFVNVAQNPVLSSTNLSFGINENSNVRISVYNNLGNEVAIIVDGDYSAGVYNTSMNLSSLPSGNYIIKMVSAGETKVCKINLIK